MAINPDNSIGQQTISAVRSLLKSTSFKITGRPRYFPAYDWNEIRWDKTLWTYNFFRVYEYFFGRDFDIKPEASMRVTCENGEITSLVYAFHSWEAAIVNVEVLIREAFRKRAPFKIYIPVLQMRTTNGLSFPVFASPYLFAIAFDTSLSQVTGSGTITQAYTVTGSNPYLNTQTLIQTSGTCTGVTYAAVSGSLVDSGNSGQGGGAEKNYLFAHNAPATGSNNIVASFSAANTTTLEASSYSGCAQSGQPEAHSFFQSNAATSFSSSVTVATANAWLVGGLRLQGTATEGANTTMRPTAVALGMCDSNSAQATGSRSMTVTSASGYGIIFVSSVAPASAAYTLTLSETITLTDTLSRLTGKAFSETLTFTDTLTRIASKVLNETLTLTDTLNKAISRAFDETLTLTDTVQKTLSRAFNETLTFTDSILKQAARAFTETITLTDTLTTSLIRYLTLSEILTLSDVLGKRAGKVLSETVTFTDSMFRQATKVLSETLTLTDTIAKSLSRALSETITFIDVLTKTISRSFSEAVTFTDYFIKQVSRTLSETLSLTDAVEKQLGRALSETIAFMDTLSKQAGKVLSEAMTFTDSLVRQTTRVFSETLTLTDTLTRSISRLLSETLTLTDTLIVRRFSAIKTAVLTLRTTQKVTVLLSKIKNIVLQSKDT